MFDNSNGSGMTITQGHGDRSLEHAFSPSLLNQITNVEIQVDECGRIRSHGVLRVIRIADQSPCVILS